MVKRKKSIKLTTLCMLCMCFAVGCSGRDWSNYSSIQLFQADPTIFVDKHTYYLYGTNELDASKGFKVYVSQDLTHWETPEDVENGYALKQGDTFGNSGFWAPQVFFYKDSYYMAYTADEQIAIAKSASPLGPFTQSEKASLFKNAEYKTIDPYVFFDEDGEIYLYYVKQNGGNNLYVAKLKEDFSGIEEDTEKECIVATKEWENTDKVSWPVTEGPTVIKKDGIYYMFYSANDFRNSDYSVGYATSDSPVGPWEKQEAPIISRKNIPANGTGHGDIFMGKDNQLFYVLHTHNDKFQATPRRTGIVKLNFIGGKEGPGIFSADKESFYYIERFEDKQ